LFQIFSHVVQIKHCSIPASYGKTNVLGFITSE